MAQTEKLNCTKFCKKLLKTNQEIKDLEEEREDHKIENHKKFKIDSNLKNFKAAVSTSHTCMHFHHRHICKVH